MVNSTETDQKLYLSTMGIIGAGKSTAAELIAKHFNFAFLPENYGENPFMADYYDDPKKWAFLAQLFFYLSKAEDHQSALPALLDSSEYAGVVDDSPLAQDGAYAYMHSKLGNMTDKEWLLYKKAFDHRNLITRPPSLVIYLPTSIPVALKRIKKRGRDYEQNIQPEYLAGLDESLRYAFERLPKQGIATAEYQTDNVNLVKNKRDQQQFLKFVDAQIAQLKTQTY